MNMLVQQDPGLARKKELAQAMTARGMNYGPVQHWTQGLDRVASSLLGAYTGKKADQEQQGRQEGIYKELASIMAGQASPEQKLRDASAIPGINPEAIFSLQMQQAMQPKVRDPIADYRQKKEIDKELNVGSAGGFGDVNPRDFTPESLAVFSKTGDYNDLVRHEPTRSVNGVIYAPNYKTGQWEPVVNPEQMGSDAAVVTSAKETAKDESPQGQLDQEKTQLDIMKREFEFKEAERSKENAEKAAEQTIKLIDMAIEHPGREAATGASSMFNRMALPGSQRTDFLTLADQLKGKNFLEGYESLKGGGQITEIEGLKAQQAQNRLNEAQSEGEYLAALKEMRDLVAERKARMTDGGPVNQGGGWSIEVVE